MPKGEGNDSSARDELKRRIDQLPDTAIQFVSRFLGSVEHPPAASRTSGIWFGLPPWVEYFGYEIGSHHGTTTLPLGLDGFEAAFRNTCEAMGWTVSPPASRTQRFVDLVVSQSDSSVSRRLSLKSTAARHLSPTTAHISKLTEAAWIQDQRTAASRQEATVRLISEFIAAVDAIVLLRAFRTEDGAIPDMYQMLEMPTSLLEPLRVVPREAFVADGPTIPLPFDEMPPALRLSLDRSDAKITLRSVRLDRCVVHAEWSPLKGT